MEHGKIDLSILVTGAGGYVGSEVVKSLCNDYQFKKVIGTDIAVRPKFYQDLNAEYYQNDIRDENKINQILSEHNIDVVIHLAALLPGKDGTRRELEYSVNVDGTKNILDCCLKNHVQKIIVSSSGAAYGYHADNEKVISEEHPLRGNPEFPYSEQKTIIENMLKEYREKHPQLKQVIFRLSATIGGNVKNQISDFFEKPVVVGIKGEESPFVFIWDQDVVNCLIKAAIEIDNEGVFNLSADGAVPFKIMAKLMKKPFIPLPYAVFYNLLRVLYKLKLSQYHQGQSSFLKYRPMLSNNSLKNDFGYHPKKSSLEAFEYYLSNRQA